MSLGIFAVVAFVLGGLIIMSRDRIPEHMRKPLALVAIFMVVSAFVMVVARFILLDG